MKKLNIFQLMKWNFFPFKNVIWKKTMSFFYRKIQGTQITFKVCASKISLNHPHDMYLLLSWLIIKSKSKQKTNCREAAMKLLFYLLFSFFSLNVFFFQVWCSYPTYLFFPALVKSSLLPLALPMNDMHSSNYFLVCSLLEDYRPSSSFLFNLSYAFILFLCHFYKVSNSKNYQISILGMLKESLF